MKYFFDTEFIESAGGIELVSLGIVCEDGRTFYAECSTFDERNADEWVKDNVLMKLDYWNYGKSIFSQNTIIQDGEHVKAFGTESWIKTLLLGEFLNAGTDRNPEFYAYYGAYDWVLFARIFGRLIDKPYHFPMWVRDLKQMMWERGLDTDWKRQNCPDPEGEHNALVDALWNQKLHGLIVEHNVTV